MYKYTQAVMVTAVLIWGGGGVGVGVGVGVEVEVEGGILVTCLLQGFSRNETCLIFPTPPPPPPPPYNDNVIYSFGYYLTKPKISAFNF